MQQDSDEAGLQSILYRNAKRILPLLVAGYVLNSLDKTNIGFAALEMNKDLGFSPQIFGLGAGLFFLTYTLFEIPSNLLIRRVGPRRWLARILITWGLVSMAMALTAGPTSFYTLRLLLGVAEAGFYPGVLYLLSTWFPKQWKARAIMVVFLGVPISAIIGGPLSGALLTLPPYLGLRGWQWLFIVEGLPTVLLGIAGLTFLRNVPDEAEWLSSGEKQVLARALTPTCVTLQRHDGSQKSPAYASRMVLFSAINLMNGLAVYSAFIWLPRIIKDLSGLTNLHTGFLAAVPFLFSGFSLILLAYSSDRFGERRWHTAIPFMIAGLAMIAMAATRSPVLQMVWLTTAMTAAIGAQGNLYALISEGLEGERGGTGYAARLATITTVGNLGGFFGPYGIGLLLANTGNFHLALMVIGGVFALGAVLAAAARPAASSQSLRLASTSSQSTTIAHG